MQGEGNKFSRFWEELKRRKVIRVMAMYAATAFIIIEAADIMLPRLGLPDWTVTFIIILLITGFPVALILSWIFDVGAEGIRKTEAVEEDVPKQQSSVTPGKRKLRASDVIIAVLFAGVVILLYPKVFKADRMQYFKSKGEISVAVMPFRNMTNDTIWNIWQSGIQDIIISSLSNSEELKVRQPESINVLVRNRETGYASITPSVAREISMKLDANVFVHGNIKQAGSILRIYVQIIDSKTEEVFKSFQIEGPSEEDHIFHMADSLSRVLRDFLIISGLKKNMSHERQEFLSTHSPEAYRYFLYGSEAFYERDFPKARDWFFQAVEVDSNFISAAVYISSSYANQGLYEQGKKWCLRLYRNRESLNLKSRITIDWLYAMYFETPYQEISHLEQLLEIDDQLPVIYYLLGMNYNSLNQYDKAIPPLERSLEIFEKWYKQPHWFFSYAELGIAYHETGMTRKEKRLYNKAEKVFTDDPVLLYRQAVLALSEGKTGAAHEYIERYRTTLKEKSVSASAIAASVGRIYWDAGLPEKAEEYYRKACSLDPERPSVYNNLGWFLIDTDRNVEEGLELVDKALESDPDNYIFLDTKGWGLYKQGEYREALEVLERSWDLKPVYHHEVFLHLEEVRQAVSRRSAT